MFGIGTTELIIILLVALVVLGPAKLPGIARSLGKALGEFRRVTTDVQRTLNLEAARIEEDEREKTKKASPKETEEPKPAAAKAQTDACVPPPQCVDPSPTHTRVTDKADPTPEIKPTSEAPASPVEPSIQKSPAQAPLGANAPKTAVPEDAVAKDEQNQPSTKDQA
ncbi:sec-independent protein translocase protein TatB [Desulfonatronum thiosulfatophilum]|uniref:Sec-independent protein translocase protein TatA n=1 Tax=Desulfonatronum thiosulfatophilum TaxID=617002 RepID=A0A1G6BYC6_9BACT|nr:Sec-independent protein translocase protein TatB [Desulfonatronum thiosulfatophilum]SDB25588.1 sec-independent protein translocase protein TatB [Desulfonatronum thiosulfatophilum]